MKLIAIIGPIGSGKTTLAGLLAKNWPGSKILTLSAFIAEELRTLGQSVNRETLGFHVARQRQVMRLEYWSEVVMSAAENRGYSRLIIDGVRTPCDAKYLLRRGATLVGISADEDLRFARVRERAREGEPVTDEDLSSLLRDDWKSGGIYGCDIEQCLSIALESGAYIINGAQPLSAIEIIARQILAGFT